MKTELIKLLQLEGAISIHEEIDVKLTILVQLLKTLKPFVTSSRVLTLVIEAAHTQRSPSKIVLILSFIAERSIVICKKV